MKLKLLSLMLLLGLTSVNANAFTKYPKSTKNLETNNLSAINSAYDLLEYQRKAKHNSNMMIDLLQQEARHKQLKDYAYTLAIKTAIHSHLSKTNADIEKISRDLDTIYNFEPLMIQGRVVPPVITESKDLYNQENPHQIRLSGAVYDVFKQAKFSTTAPNWRDYLTFHTNRNAYELIAYGATNLEPKNDYERELWVKATQDGWEQGIIQANNIVMGAMDRLNRDYVGMVRFHQFVQTKKITMPIINTYHLYDTNSGDRLILDETLLQIEKLPTFQLVPKNPTQAMTPEIASFYGYNPETGEHMAKVLTSQDKELDPTELLSDLTTIKPPKGLNTLPKTYYDTPLKVEIKQTFIFKETEQNVDEKLANQDEIVLEADVKTEIENADYVGDNPASFLQETSKP